jgi:hypothetical protein
MQPASTRPDTRQSRALAVLAIALVAMLALWAVGAYLLLAFTPDFGDLPE